MFSNTYINFPPSFISFTYTKYVLSFVLFTFSYLLSSCHLPSFILFTYATYVLAFVLSNSRTYSLLAIFLNSFLSFHLHLRPFLLTFTLTHLPTCCHPTLGIPFPYTTYVLSFVLFTFTHLISSCYFPLVILSPLVSTVQCTYIAFIILSTVRTYSLLPTFVHSIYKFFLFFFYLL
jgi:hypothetical protein